MFIRISMLFLVVSLLSSCVSNNAEDANKQPDWVSGHSEQYSQKQSLLGVGEADTMADAKSRARAEIAKIFNVAIDASTVDRGAFESTTLNQLTTTGESLLVAREVRESTSQRLEGVSIAQVWKDSASQRVYALAILPRLKTTMSLRREIEQIDSASHALIDKARAQASLITKIRQSDQAISLQFQRRVLNKQLKVVSIVGEGVTAPWSLKKLMVDRDTLLARISINVEARGKQADKLQQTLANVLANQGFQVTTEGDYTLIAVLDSTALPPQNGWHYQKAVLTVSLSGENKTSLGGYDWDFKVSSTEGVLADVRVLEKARSLLEMELKRKLFALMEAGD